ncbi:c-type cytochrome [Phenylobacterium sp.]|uniref:c-type cytochrome n=1 Tax=Phenylobacterium sp. TaxID=1871053 RepID=UPI003784E5B3
MKSGFAFAAAAALVFAASSAAAQVAKPPAFAACQSCHAVTKGQKSGMGPNLFGVGGRKAGTLADYKYSPAMVKYGQPWTRANLIEFISNPRTAVPGTKMIYPGQKNPQIAGQLADYLLSLK